MVTCPVCEAPARGRLCDICGHAFAPEPGGAAVPLTALDLDIPPLAAVPLALEPLLDMEPTRFAAVSIAPTSADLELLQTRLPAAPDVAAGGLEALETGRETTPSEPTLASTDSVVCRYCRNVQTSGMLCERCGMRLPWSAKAAVPAAPLLDDDSLVLCPQCGTRTYPRERCAGCGRQPQAEGSGAV